MSESSERSDRFSSLRDAFDDLAFDEKAAFLVETAVGVVVESIKKAGDLVADTLDNSGCTEAPGSDGDKTSGGEAAGDDESSGKPEGSSKKKASSSKKKA